MASPRDLWLVDFGDPFPSEPAATRPALVLGPPPTFGPRFPIVVLCPLTTVHRGLSVHVEVEPTPSNGLDATSYVQCELLRSVSRRRLVRRLGSVDAVLAGQVREIIETLLPW